MDPTVEASDKSDMVAEMQTNAGEENYALRRLEASDYAKGFLDLLGQLSVCGQVSEEEFTKRFEELQGLGDDHFVCVIEDLQSGRIVATGTILVEKKFLRTCGKVGHIEDVVVDSSVRGKHLGHKILKFLTQRAKVAGCYKVILDCSVENKVFMKNVGSRIRIYRCPFTFDRMSFQDYTASDLGDPKCGSNNGVGVQMPIESEEEF